MTKSSNTLGYLQLKTRLASSYVFTETLKPQHKAGSKFVNIAMTFSSFIFFLLGSALFVGRNSIGREHSAVILADTLIVATCDDHLASLKAQVDYSPYSVK